MHVVLGNVRQLEVDHVRQLTDVQPTRGDFRGNERSDAVLPELAQRPRARVLALVAVDRGGGNPCGLQLLRQTIGGVLGTGKHQHLLPLAALDEMRQQVPLVRLRHAVHLLRDALGGGVARGDLDGERLAQESRGEPADIVRVGGREHQVLTLPRQQLQDPADVVDEAHVEHAIGLIEHAAAYRAEIERALAGEIEQPTRSGDKQITAGAQGLDLRLLAHAAEDHRRAQRAVAAVAAGALGHLRGQLTRRSEHQRARRAPLRLAKPLQDRQHERRRLAGAGLRAREHVASGEHRRNGGALNRRRRGIAFFGNSTHQPGLEPEIRK